jgi:hypothetical protein
MKKRTAEKVISRSILSLAMYRKSTMARALQRRPSFWTVDAPGVAAAARPRRRRLRFGEGSAAATLSIEYEQSRPAPEAQTA